MSTIFAFIRHGETKWNKAKRLQGHTDIALNDTGIAQAEKVASRLAQESWDIIYSSDLQRAHETARIIGKATGLQAITDVRLREKRFGLTEGTTPEERIEKWGENYTDLDLQAETDEQVWDRGFKAIQEMITSHTGKKILIVSHGIFIHRMLTNLVPSYELNDPIKNTSVTELKYEDERWSCTYFSCTKHITGKVIKTR